MDQQPLLRLEEITKAYPGVVANDHITIDVYPGEVHSIVGENGAGKTTLMGIAYGLRHPDAGRTLIEGIPVAIRSPRDALHLGIGFVQQHLSLVPSLTVAQNLVLALGGGQRAISLRDGTVRVRELSKRFGLEVDPNAIVSKLGIGQQQRAELLKALAGETRILLLDEPNALLTPQEWSELAVILRRLADDGKGIVLISHKLGAVLEVSDRISVLRRGSLVETIKASDASEAQLAKMMVGALPERRWGAHALRERDIGDARLEVEGLWVKGDRGGFAVKGVSFSVRSGEVVGIAGVEGSGQVELTEALAGARPSERGSIKLAGLDITGIGVSERQRIGVAHVPSDRQTKGLVLDLSVAENLALPIAHQNPQSRFGVLNLRAIEDRARRLIDRFDIRVAGPHIRSGALSGGNQQKVILAQALSGTPQTLLCCYPTRGLDFAAAMAVQKEIVSQTQKGAAVVYASTELDELLELTDRIVVLHNGSVSGVLRTSDTTSESLGLLMGGTSV